MRELFEPASIAVVGAAREENKVGHIVLRNIISSGFTGKLYPVNPKSEEILGLRCYGSISLVPDDVDLVVVTTPARTVPGIIEEAGHKGTRAAIVISAGFKETGKDGAELERQIGVIARSYGMRILGPNCLGMINTHSMINATFTNLVRALYKQLPVKGSTYTVREVFLGREKVVKGGDSATVGLLLEELLNGPDPFHQGKQELGFSSERFAPLEELPDAEEELAVGAGAGAGGWMD